MGEAGNGRYTPKEQISAMRIGNEVLVQFPGHLNSAKSNHTIPATAIAKGFGPEIDGKELKEFMVEGKQYAYHLQCELD